MLALKFLVAAIAAVFTIVGGGSAAAQAQRTVAVVGADVLTMTEAGKRNDQTVITSGDRIVALGPRSKVAVPAGAIRIDGRGMTLMPGLVDMHVHLAPEPGKTGDAAQRALAVMLGHGTTTARGMAGSPANLEVRNAIESGALPGPRFYAAAPAMHDGNTPSAEAARQSVAKAREAGYDLIKSHHLTDLASWQAVQSEARKQALPVAGHVANEIGVDRALAAGQQIEHLDGFIYELLPPDAPERQIEFAQVPPPQVIAAASKASDAQIEGLARRVAARGAYLVPTLSLFEKISDLRTSTEYLGSAPGMRFVPDAAIQQWTAQRRQFAEQTGYTAETAESFRALRRRIASALHRAGVPLMAGSDTAQAFHVWGPGLIDEIEALAAAGMTNMEALRSATVVPRNYFGSLPRGGSHLGWKADFGTVEEGARADLLLLRGDPSRNLRALRNVETVIAAGKVFQRDDLDTMLAEAGRAAKAGNPTTAAPAAQPDHPVFIMRHLDTARGDDPELSAEGKANAARLARYLTDAGIKAVFVTRTRRAMETGNAVAGQAGIPTTIYDHRDVGGLIRAVQAVGGPVLIVGHSNTAPDLVAAFGGDRPGPIDHEDFGTVWRVGPGSKPAIHELDGR